MKTITIEIKEKLEDGLFSPIDSVDIELSKPLGFEGTVSIRQEAIDLIDQNTGYLRKLSNEK